MEKESEKSINQNYKQGTWLGACELPSSLNT